MRFIILFECFQYLYYLQSYSTFWLPKKGLFCLMELSPFLVTFHGKRYDKNMLRVSVTRHGVGLGVIGMGSHHSIVYHDFAIFGVVQ